MAFALVANTGSGSTTGNTFATAGINTTGANLLVAAVGTYIGTGGVVTDSNGNTWNKLTVRGIGATIDFTLWWSSPTTVGSGHTFTCTTTATYPSMCVQAWSGAAASPFDQENGAATGAATSLATGSLTPSENNCLVVSGVCEGGADSDATVDSSMTRSDLVVWVSAQHVLSAMSYIVQTTAAAINPTWSWASTISAGVGIATFKAAAVAGGTTHFLPTLGAGA